MSLEDCQETTDVSRIKVEESGRSAVFLNLERLNHTKTQVDGCVVSNAIAADWVITKPDVGDIIVELKGRNVEQGLKQVTATAKKWKSEDWFVGERAALIVCSQHPAITSTVQRAKDSFAKEYGGPLHVVCGNREFQFDRVLSFRGPGA